MDWQIILAIAVPTDAVLIAAIEARGRGKQDIADIRKDHDHLAEKVDDVKDEVTQLVSGQAEIKGSLNTLLAFIKPVAAEEAFAKSADEPVGTQPSR